MRKNLVTFSRPLLLKAGEVCSAMKMRNPAQGVRGHGPRSTWPTWGASSLVTGRTGGDLLRGLLESPAAANSSTMKGPRGLVGELCGRRSRTAKDQSRWVRGCFYVRSPEMVVLKNGDRNYAGSGELDIRLSSLPVTRDSNVSREVEVMTNAGSSAAAGVVTGAWCGQPGASNAVEWECGLSRSCAGRGREPATASASDVLCKAVETRWCRYGWCRR